MSLRPLNRKPHGLTRESTGKKSSEILPLGDTEYKNRGRQSPLIASTTLEHSSHNQGRHSPLIITPTSKSNSYSKNIPDSFADSAISKHKKNTIKSFSFLISTTQDEHSKNRIEGTLHSLLQAEKGNHDTVQENSEIQQLPEDKSQSDMSQEFNSSAEAWAGPHPNAQSFRDRQQRQNRAISNGSRGALAHESSHYRRSRRHNSLPSFHRELHRTPMRSNEAHPSSRYYWTSRYPSPSRRPRNSRESHRSQHKAPHSRASQKSRDLRNSRVSSSRKPRRSERVAQLLQSDATQAFAGALAGLVRRQIAEHAVKGFIRHAQKSNTTKNDWKSKTVFAAIAWLDDTVLEGKYGVRGMDLDEITEHVEKGGESEYGRHRSNPGQQFDEMSQNKARVSERAHQTHDNEKEWETDNHENSSHGPDNDLKKNQGESRSEKNQQQQQHRYVKRQRAPVSFSGGLSAPVRRSSTLKEMLETTTCGLFSTNGKKIAQKKNKSATGPHIMRDADARHGPRFATIDTRAPVEGSLLHELGELSLQLQNASYQIDGLMTARPKHKCEDIKKVKSKMADTQNALDEAVKCLGGVLYRNTSSTRKKIETDGGSEQGERKRDEERKQEEFLTNGAKQFADSNSREENERYRVEEFEEPQKFSPHPHTEPGQEHATKRIYQERSETWKNQQNEQEKKDKNSDIGLCEEYQHARDERRWQRRMQREKEGRWHGRRHKGEHLDQRHQRQRSGFY